MAAAGGLLRFATAGSVDDGKSTLIGRLLYDTKSIFEDQWEAVQRKSRDMGGEYVNLALLTDGLRAEREQGITIDVAYRYFATPRRKFIIADTPGHVQYTRNMVTGASTAELALVLIDARNGLLEQSRRHAFIASLLGIRHMVVCVNKMDLVDYAQQDYERIREQFEQFARRLETPDITYIPISALHGDNVVERSTVMDWYEGVPLLQYLEELEGTTGEVLQAQRFPVQYVVRPMSDRYPDYRGYAGTVASGVFRPGDEVTVLPSGARTSIRSIESFDGPLDEAAPGMAVTLRLSDELDISRGDMIVDGGAPPEATQDIEAMVCWMADGTPLAAGERYALKQTTRNVRVTVREVAARLDVNTLTEDGAAETLALNEIGRVRLRTTSPLFVDRYRSSRATGSFILIDERTHNTVGAGMILGTGR